MNNKLKNYAPKQRKERRALILYCQSNKSKAINFVATFMSSYSFSNCNFFKSSHLAILKAESKTIKSWLTTPSHFLVISVQLIIYHLRQNIAVILECFYCSNFICFPSTWSFVEAADWMQFNMPAWQCMMHPQESHMVWEIVDQKDMFYRALCLGQGLDNGEIRLLAQLKCNW